MYFNGNGIIQDYELALSWYKKAAEQGLLNAQYNLGVMYFNGHGYVTQDYELALSWFAKKPLIKVLLKLNLI